MPVTEGLMDQVKQNNIVSDPYFIIRYQDDVTQAEKKLSARK